MKISLSCILCLLSVFAFLFPLNQTVANADSILYGDVNSDNIVSLKDATDIQKYNVGLLTLSDGQKTCGDVNADGSVTLKDATMIQKYLAEIISSFPAQTPVHSDSYWQFRCVGTMNITRDQVSNTSVTDTQQGGAYWNNINTAINYAKAANANYAEIALMFDQKSTPQELIPYFSVVPTLARQSGMNVYYRMTPPQNMQGELINSTGTEFTQACQNYFAYLKQFMTGMGTQYIQNGDIFSTWAEGDCQFTTALGWTDGTAKYKQYVQQMGSLIQAWKQQSGIKFYYTESVCGGEARIRDQFDAETCKYIDFISWDNYVGIGGGQQESLSRLTAEANDMVSQIQKYSVLYNTKIALGEWSTHWDTAKTRDMQAQYINTLATSLSTISSKYFVGMEYFDFALPQIVINYNSATTYYACPVLDKGGTYVGYDALKNVFQGHMN
ncbi:MAG: dockerin type I repeat-containing protein [Bacillota bacterium]|nr:dockerin type I repeat-containing protein [Bacillota bacterium]